ncbi:MAG: glycine--tRNA ligase [Candidatus Aenigmatarchaeota archaeon]
MEILEKIINICLRRGIIFPTAEIYGSVSGFYELGEIGKRIKDKLISLWKNFFVEENFVEIEGSIILPKDVLDASGHTKSFVDPIVKCKKCQTVFRADHLIEEKLNIYVEGKSVEELNKIIKEKNIKCPKCNNELEDVKEFNLMFKTFIGPLAKEEAFLRPETAQNIFIAFKRIMKSYRKKLPFAIYQVGYSFRNEISPRQFLIRLRFFTQAEIEMFFDPENENCPIENYLELKIPLLTREAQRKNSNEITWIKIKELLEKGIIKSKWQAYFLAKEFLFFTEVLKISEDKLRFRHVLEEETPFYSAGNFDLEYYFEGIGWKEIVGNAYRTDYDLSTHSKHSKEDLSVEKDGKKFIPHVAEPSFGIERILLALFFEHYREREWPYFSFPYKISPYLIAVFPLVKNKEEILKKTREVYEFLKKEFGQDVIIDISDSIGKLYARADEIGIPFAITIDYQTLQDNTVTIRFRDSKEQKRLKIEEIPNFIKEILKE